ncbi:MAG: ATP-binding cassette domain-containing protein [candidate division WOR-3 bacterium]
MVFDEGVYIVRGPNGSGKSTLLGIIAGIIKPSKGEVRVLGKDPFKDDGVKKFIGFVGHKTFLLEDLTGYENWRFFGEFDKDLADLMNIDKVLNRPVRTYSRGESVKLSVCIELSRKPKVLLLDEPFSPLDEASKESLTAILNGFEGTVVITAHGTIPLKAKMEYKLEKHENLGN